MVAHDGTTDCETPGSVAKLDELARLLSEQNPERIEALEGILMSDLVETLKFAIANSDKSRYANAHESNVSEAVLSRFVNGERGITLETAGKLSEVLGLNLISPMLQRQKAKRTKAEFMLIWNAANDTTRRKIRDYVRKHPE